MSIEDVVKEWYNIQVIVLIWNKGYGGIMSLVVKEGNYISLGAISSKNQVIFTFEGEKEDVCRVILVSKETQERVYIDVPEDFCMGSLRSVLIMGINPKEYNYLYEINGNEILDPYTRVVVGREKWNDLTRKNNKKQLLSGFAQEEFAWGEDKFPEILKSQMIMYKLHVRGFSMGMKASEKTKGTFVAVKNKIPYLKDLGITTVELMPIYEFEEMPIQKELQVPEYVKWQVDSEDMIQPSVLDSQKDRLNYWGYGEGNYFAVKASYAFDSHKASHEFKKLVKALHENGMECVTEMYFPADVSSSMILDALRFWVKEYHIDGIHIMGENLPMKMIIQDPLLSRTKIFAADFLGYESLCRKYKNLYLYKEEYQYSVRQLLNHYDCDIREFLNQQKKQSEKFGYINYVASNNGFPLLDVFSYNDKHNEANGENNTDGSDYNLSNNYGIEGPTKKRFINEIRRSRMRSAYMLLLFAQGIPLIMAGDEFGNTQSGNNNAYCQDNAIGWVNWGQFAKYKEEREVIKKLIAFRKAHSLLTKDVPYKFCDYRSIGVPDLSYHGEYAWLAQMDPGRKNIGILYCGDYATEGQNSDHIYIGYNFYSEEIKFALPVLPQKEKWYLKIDSTEKNVVLEEEQLLNEQQYVTVSPNSICLLLGK